MRKHTLYTILLHAVAIVAMAATANLAYVWELL